MQMVHLVHTKRLRSTRRMDRATLSFFYYLSLVVHTVHTKYIKSYYTRVWVG